MKSLKKATVILLFALLVSAFATGCAGCGTDTTKNTNDMVEQTSPAEKDNIGTDNTLNNDTQTLPSQEATDSNGGNATADQIMGDPNAALDNNTDNTNDNNTSDNGNTTNEKDNTANNGGLVEDAGNAVGDAMDNVGSAVDDVVDGVGNGVRDLTK